MRQELFIPLVVMICVAPSSCSFGEHSNVLVMGKPGIIDRYFSYFIPDPMTNPTPVLLRTVEAMAGEDIMKSIRIYFPRTYDRLLDFEFLVLSEIEVSYLSPQQIEMLYNAIYEEGLGAQQTRSVMSMADSIAHPWADSVLSDAFPNDADAVVAQKNWCFMRAIRYIINSNPNIPPVYRPYRGLDGTEYAFNPGGSSTTCITIPKEGAVVTSYQVGAFKVGQPGALPDPEFSSPTWVPHSMYWRYGNGTTWTHSERITEYWNNVYNPYGPDMLLAEIIFSTGRRLPDDVVLVHNLRRRFWEYRSASAITLSFLEFVDLFGADTSAISLRMAEVSTGFREAQQLYLDQEYDQSLSQMDDTIEDMESLLDDALRLKDQALLWVYLIEWLSVTGVLMIASFTLWTLMVRRRLYREVAVTRKTYLE